MHDLKCVPLGGGTHFFLPSPAAAGKYGVWTEQKKRLLRQGRAHGGRVPKIYF